MITQYFQSELTFSHVEASSKKRALEKAATIISKRQDGINSEDLFELLIARERLGSTGIGKGIAIPHCRHDQVQDISCCLITLKDSVDFDAIDNNPVDILFVLVVPEKSCDQHLETLASLANLMDNAQHRNQLRQAITNKELFDYAINMQD
jgi:PTS system nitrogen regulatory IIA component